MSWSWYDVCLFRVTGEKTQRTDLEGRIHEHEETRCTCGPVHNPESQATMLSGVFTLLNKASARLLVSLWYLFEWAQRNLTEYTVSHCV